MHREKIKMGTSLKTEDSFARLASLVIFTLIFGFLGTALYAVDCPHPAVSSVGISPNTVVGGIGATSIGHPNDFTATITFGAAIPQGCNAFLIPNRSPGGAGLNPFFCTAVAGNGTAQSTCLVPTQVVDATQNGVTVSFQARLSQTGATVGSAVSSQAVSITPVTLHSFTIDKTQLANGQAATGTILLEGVVSNTTKAAVNISASPSAAVSVPSSIQIPCCAFDGAGHSKGTFTITARAVAANTTVTISVKRPGQTALTKTILVKH